MLLSFLVSLIPIVLVVIFSGSIGFLSEKETKLFYVKEDDDADLRYRVRSDDSDSLGEIEEKLPTNDYSEEVMEEELQKVQKKYEEKASAEPMEEKRSVRPRAPQRRQSGRNPASPDVAPRTGSVASRTAPAGNYNRSTNVARPGMRNNYGSDALDELQSQIPPTPNSVPVLQSGRTQRVATGSSSSTRTHQIDSRRMPLGQGSPVSSSVRPPGNAAAVQRNRPPMSRPPTGQSNRAVPPRGRTPAPRGTPPRSSQNQDLGIDSLVGRDAQIDAEEALRRIQQGGK